MSWLFTLSCIVPWDADADGYPWTSDCDDRDPAVFRLSWYPDADLDGYGDPFRAVQACEAPEGYLAVAGDCDDSDSYIPAYHQLDDDDDGFYSAWCAGGDDCDDDDPWTYPGAQELCTGLPNDCSDSAWTSDAGLVVWMEELETGTPGEACSVASRMEGGGPTDCLVRLCPSGHIPLTSTLCCVCDLSETFAALSDAAPGVWNIALPEGPGAFAPSGHLSFCEGEWPVNLKLEQSSGQPQTVTLTGDTTGFASVDLDSCEAGTAQGLSVLRGSGEQPVVAALGNGGLSVRVEDLVLTSGAECPPNPSSCPEQVEGGKGGGLLLRDLVDAYVYDTCIRQNASTDGAGGGITLVGVSFAALENLVVLDNCAFRGGGLYAASSQVSLASSTLQHNTAWCYGGGALVYGASADVTNILAGDSLTLEENTADLGIGAGLMLWGNPDADLLANLVDTSVSHNEGAGISVVDTVNIRDAAYPVCASLSLKRVVFAGQPAGVDIDSVDLFTLTQSEVLGQDLGEVAEASYTVEGCL